MSAEAGEGYPAVLRSRYPGWDVSFEQSRMVSSPDVSKGYDSGPSNLV